MKNDLERQMEPENKCEAGTGSEMRKSAIELAREVEQQAHEYAKKEANEFGEIAREACPRDLVYAKAYKDVYEQMYTEYLEDRAFFLDVAAEKGESKRKRSLRQHQQREREYARSLLANFRTAPADRTKLEIDNDNLRADAAAWREHESERLEADAEAEKQDWPSLPERVSRDEQKQ